MTDRERLAHTIREAYGNAVREENPRMTLHIAAEPFDALPHERQRKWLAMAAAAERQIAGRDSRVMHRAIATLRSLDCEGEACLTPGEVLRMLGVGEEEP